MIITTTAASNNMIITHIIQIKKTTNSMKETTHTMAITTIMDLGIPNNNNQSLVVSILIQMSRQLTILTNSSMKMNSEAK